MTTAEILILVGLALIIALLVLVLLRLRGSGDGNGAHIERLERELRQELQASAQSTRQETAGHLAQYHNASVQQFDSMRQQMQLQSSSGREEQARALKRFADTLQQTLGNLTESNAQRMLEVRNTLESKIRDLQADNGKRLEEMRQTVDEKLHATLETRLTESFRQVSERLEKVHQGLGEMQQLAIGVGDLKRVLTNVKTRGTWGEVQLEMLLEQVLTVEQYAKNVETVAGSNARVEFAIKLPGTVDGGAPLWLPIDAKFPKEQYERLQAAADIADAEGVIRAGAELERAVRREAQTICDKYVSPPQTTDFAILFLPTEGLYAEVMRRPGLADDLQRTLRVTIAGPSTLSALLNSLQMGFRTLALEKRSSEVWQVLGAVKTEFTKFGDVLAATKTTLERAAKNIENAEVRSRQMARKLKSVEALPSEAAQLLLGSDGLERED
ncbi:MAG: DNA recombination protein RmuC [Massilia sp.]|jgi:DNA recombination protein RmuC|uniref:DNA recombination protein RmuC n=1 Tax=Massilia sp. TaxID=1882437 RepID=UPI0019BB7537|nr:DNA recombination protein RmuC [Oxalobacteraceae sp. CFBP 8763]MBD8626007.1 DNA recombination protein RmuC [Oxalobacteraceae sp. CFBP 8753]MBD8724220.1 DNA recombination protein RmuC [Oxalobacteraceae sp. CFBP 13708]